MSVMMDTVFSKTAVFYAPANIQTVTGIVMNIASGDRATGAVTAGMDSVIGTVTEFAVLHAAMSTLL